MSESCTTFILDRIEGAMAILEVNGHTLELPTSALPAGAKEGDAFALAAIGRPDTSEAEARLARLRQRDPGGSEFDL